MWNNSDIGSKFRNAVLISLGISLGGWLAQTCSPPPPGMAKVSASSMLDAAVKQAKDDKSLWSDN